MCSFFFRPLESSAASVYVKSENHSEAADWSEPEGLWVGDYICTPFSHLSSLRHLLDRTVNPSSLIHLPWTATFISISFIFSHFLFLFPFLSFPFPSLPPLPPLSASLWQAATVGHGWQMAGWRGPRLHYAGQNETWRALYISRMQRLFPEAADKEQSQCLTKKPALLCFKGAVTFWIPACSASRAGHLSLFGKVKHHQRTLEGFFPFLLFSQ